MRKKPYGNSNSRSSISGTAILSSGPHGDRWRSPSFALVKRKKTIALAFLGAIILFVYGVIPTLQPAHFGRVYAAYGGIFIISSIVWCRIVDKKKPDRYEVIGSIVTVIGAMVYFILRDKTKNCYYFLVSAH